MQLQDRVVIITGGASGLGQATSRHFIERGAKVALFDLNEEQGRAYARELGDNAEFFKVNVTSESDIKQAIDGILQKWNKIHICLNCAGIAPAGKTVGRNGALALEKFTAAIQINLIGTFNVLRLAAEVMAKNEPDEEGERGVIINTASVAAFDGQIGQAAYSASKAGVAGMTLPIARDLGPLGIRVNSIAPGVFNTPMMAAMPDEVRESLEAIVQSPKRLGEPVEYARLAAHIVENGYLNGETIRLDGGIRMPPK